MRNDRLVMVMPYRQLVRKAVAAGFRVWAVWDTGLDAGARAEIESLAQELVLIDLADHDKLRATVRDLAAAADPAWVVHLGSEESMVAVAEVAETLGIAPNPASALHALNDKIAMRRLLAEQGLSAVRTEPVPTRDEVRSRLTAFGLPAIVKPAGASGSRAVALIREPSELDSWAAEAERIAGTGPFLLEEYLEGPEFSVETLTVDGKHLVAGVTAKSTTGAPNFVETGHLHPAPLPEPERAAIAGLAVELLDAAGYRFGPAHTEVILTAAGPRIVESQARLGGDRIPVLVEQASGLDLEAAVFEALAGREVTVPPPSRHAAVTFFTLRPGRVVGVDGPAGIRALPWVVDLRCDLKVGDVLPPTTNSRSRHGHAVVHADSPAQAADRVETVRSLLHVSVES